jgi:hypothetical protein
MQSYEDWQDLSILKTLLIMKAVSSILVLFFEELTAENSSHMQDKARVDMWKILLQSMKK